MKKTFALLLFIIAPIILVFAENNGEESRSANINPELKFGFFYSIFEDFSEEESDNYILLNNSLNNGICLGIFFSLPLNKYFLLEGGISVDLANYKVNYLRSISDNYGTQIVNTHKYQITSVDIRPKIMPKFRIGNKLQFEAGAGLYLNHPINEKIKGKLISEGSRCYYDSSAETNNEIPVACNVVDIELRNSEISPKINRSEILIVSMMLKVPYKNNKFSFGVTGFKTNGRTEHDFPFYQLRFDLSYYFGL